MSTIAERTFVYAIGTENGPVKVGITSNLLSRLRSLQTGSAVRLDLIWVCTVSHREEAVDIERQFHDVHTDERLLGEWFDLPAYLAIESLEQNLEFRLAFESVP